MDSIESRTTPHQCNCIFRASTPWFRRFQREWRFSTTHRRKRKPILLPFGFKWKHNSVSTENWPRWLRSRKFSQRLQWFLRCLCPVYGQIILAVKHATSQQWRIRSVEFVSSIRGTFLNAKFCVLHSEVNFSILWIYLARIAFGCDRTFLHHAIAEINFRFVPNGLLHTHRLNRWPLRRIGNYIEKVSRRILLNCRLLFRIWISPRTNAWWHWNGWEEICSSLVSWMYWVCWLRWVNSKNCPKARQGVVIGKYGVPTLRMEVVWDLNLWVW